MRGARSEWAQRDDDQKERSRARPGGTQRLQNPSGMVALGLGLSIPEAREAQVFGQRLIAAVKLWRHLQARRREGVR